MQKSDRRRESGSKVELKKKKDREVRIGVEGVKINKMKRKNRKESREVEVREGKCKEKDDLENGEELGHDYLVLSPVKATDSHPEATPLGWQAFNSLIDGINTPVYALGGLSADDLKDAWAYGAVGTAMLRGAW